MDKHSNTENEMVQYREIRSNGAKEMGQQRNRETF